MTELTLHSFVNYTYVSHAIYIYLLYGEGGGGGIPSLFSFILGNKMVMVGRDYDIL